MHDSGMGKGGNFSGRPLSAYTTQRWASTLTSMSNARHRSNTPPSVERSERSYFFGKPKAKIVPFSLIVVNCCRSRYLGINFYTFNVKKHRPLYLDFSKGLS